MTIYRILLTVAVVMSTAFGIRSWDVSDYVASAEELTKMESLVKKYRAAFDLFKEQKRLGKNTEQSRMAVGQIARQILELDLKNPAVDERLVVGHLGKPAIEVNSVDGNQKPVRKIYYLSDDVDKFHVIVIAPDNEGKVVSHYESYVRDAESE